MSLFILLVTVKVKWFFCLLRHMEKREVELKLLQLLLATERNRLAGVPTHTTDSLRRELEDIYNA